MSHTNPFAVWAHGGQGPAPSIYGTLPQVTAPSPSNLVAYRLIYHTNTPTPNVLNCTIVGPQNQAQYHVSTDKDVVGYTSVKYASGGNLALIEWKSAPALEVQNVVSRQSVGRWLRLSTDQRTRSMEIRGTRYFWAPQDRSIKLYSAASSSAVFLAKLSRGQGCVFLEISPEAIQIGLLDATVVAAVLLQCGRNID